MALRLTTPVKHLRTICVWLTLGAGLVAGCGDSRDDGPGDSAADVQEDGTIDGGTDANVDAAPPEDVQRDINEDTQPDVEPDAPPSGCTNDDECGPSPDTGGKQTCRDDGRCSPELFETVWDIPSDGDSLTLPFYDDNGKGKCDFHILWGDEVDPDFATAQHVTDCKVESNRTHTYATKGQYHVKIRGIYDGWGAFIDGEEWACSFSSQNDQLQRVVSFGRVGLTQCAFNRVGNIELPKTDIPDSVKWTNAVGAFYEAATFNQPIGDWDTSNVTDMLFMFRGAAAFNQPIGNWDTSHVTNMDGMFRESAAFNQPLADWNTSKVTKMSEMFLGAKVFDQDLSQWKLEAGVNLENIFKDSGLSKENYCKVKVLDVWKDADLGLTYDCQ